MNSILAVEQPFTVTWILGGSREFMNPIYMSSLNPEKLVN